MLKGTNKSQWCKVILIRVIGCPRHPRAVWLCWLGGHFGSLGYKKKKKIIIIIPGICVMVVMEVILVIWVIIVGCK